MTGIQRNPDPFALTANPTAYVPRRATEEALERLAVAVAAGRGAVLLVGPPGIGKTMLLRVLADRSRERWRVVYLPYPALPAPALCRWALQLLGEASAEDPETALLARAGCEHGAGRQLVLLLDDAQSMPKETWERLAELAERAGGALRLVGAALEEGDGRAPFEAVRGRPVQRVELAEPMTEAETAEYVRARLARAGAGEELTRTFEGPRLAEIQRRSGGVPARVHEIATAFVRHPRRAGGEEAAEPSEAPEAPRASPGEPPSTEAVGAEEGIGTDAPVLGDDEPGPLAEEPSAPPPAMDSPPRARTSRPGRGLEDGGRRLAAVGFVLLAIVLWGAIRNWLPEVSPPAPAVPVAPVAHSVAVNVNANPWAEVWVDDLEIGLTPLARIPLPAGERRFRARMPDGRVIERIVPIGPERRHVTFE